MEIQKVDLCNECRIEPNDRKCDVKGQRICNYCQEKHSECHVENKKTERIVSTDGRVDLSDLTNEPLHSITIEDNEPSLDTISYLDFVIDES